MLDPTPAPQSPFRIEGDLFSESESLTSWLLTDLGKIVIGGLPADRDGTTYQTLLENHSRIRVTQGKLILDFGPSSFATIWIDVFEVVARYASATSLPRDTALRVSSFPNFLVLLERIDAC